MTYRIPSRHTVQTLVCAVCILSMTTVVWAQKPKPDLTTKSIEELMDVEVTSVSKKEERLFQAAAAAFVITQEDIRRSGLTSIPELLRMVPGLDVARIDGTKYAISARGFNGRFANKLLVLIDGRSIYSSETSGVYWEIQDLPLEDIERIEVIRGPGGTLWGANAVNGVINIITRRAQETQGGLVAAGGGSEERGFGSIRYGAKMGDNAFYRVYGKYYNRSGLVDAAGNDANDGQQALRGGGRIDWTVNARDRLMVEGDIYRTTLRETPLGVSPAAPFAPIINHPGEFDGGNLMGRWTRTFSERSDIALQVYYDHFSRDIHDLPVNIDTFDVDFQHHVAVGQRHDIVWGLGYRLVADDTDTTSARPVQLNPKSHRGQLFSAFVQDDITLVKEQLRLTLGTKVEHDPFSGIEVQPSVRMLWTPTARQTVWGAVSRAVRTLTRGQLDTRINFQAFPAPDGTPTIVAVFGNRDAESETLRAYELGYRAQPSKRLSLDIATFYNIYHRLTSFEPGQPFFEIDPLPPHVVVPIFYGDLLNGRTHGIEASANLSLNTRWKVQTSYSFLRVRLQADPASRDITSVDATQEDSPRHQFQIHSYFTLPHNFELDAALYHVSSLVTQQVPDYTRLDARVGWRVSEGVALSAGLQNLLDNQHQEFNGVDIFVIPSQIKRSAYGKVTFRF